MVEAPGSADFDGVVGEVAAAAAPEACRHWIRSTRPLPSGVCSSECMLVPSVTSVGVVAISVGSAGS